MRKSLVFLTTLSLIFLVENSNAITEKKFKNCSLLNKDYPGGVAEKASSDNKNKAGVLQDSKNSPKVSSKIYKENKGLDRDKDGIACEN